MDRLGPRVTPSFVETINSDPRVELNMDRAEHLKLNDLDLID